MVSKGKFKGRVWVTYCRTYDEYEVWYKEPRFRKNYSNKWDVPGGDMGSYPMSVCGDVGRSLNLPDLDDDEIIEYDLEIS